MMNRVAFLICKFIPKKRAVEPGQTGKLGEFGVWADEIHAKCSSSYCHWRTKVHAEISRTFRLLAKRQRAGALNDVFPE
jgi:hypothetical protein